MHVEIELPTRDGHRAQYVVGEVTSVPGGDVVAVGFRIASRVAPEVAQVVGPVEMRAEGILAVRHRAVEVHQRWGFVVAGEDARIPSTGIQELSPCIVILNKIVSVTGGDQVRILVFIFPAVDPYPATSI